MTEILRQYRVLGVSSLEDLVTQLNSILGQIANRLDQIEGYRGTPTFKAVIEGVGANLIGGSLNVRDADGVLIHGFIEE